MSINGGIVSPIQRLAASKWSPEFLPFLREWRNLLLTVAKQSEPWIAARIRATSTAISRLVGPRQIDFSGTAKTTKAEELGGGKK